MPVEETVDIESTPADAFDAAADAINSGSAPADETPVDDTTTDPTTEGAPTDAEGPEAVAPATVAPTLEPFAFNAFKQRYEVPGLAFDPARRAIVAEDERSLERLKQMLSHGREWEARGRQELVSLRREVQQVKAQPHAEIEQAKVYLAEWDRMMQMAPDELLEFVQAAQMEWPKIQAKAERSYAERLLQQVQAAQQPPEPDVETVVEDARHGAAELVQDYLQDQPWATPDMHASLTQYLQDMGTMNRWVARATRDMPEHGIRAGQYVALWDDARALLEQYTTPYRDAHAKYATQQTAAAKQIQQTQSVAVTNAKVLAQAKPARSVAPPARVQPTAPKRGTRDDIIAEAFGTWREMQRAR